MSARPVVRIDRKQAGSNRLKWEAERAKGRSSGNVELFDLPPPESLEQDERYTTRDTMEWAAKISGVTGWDLDVAACEESHKAEEFYTVAMDGLSRPWLGRVWCNPPYSDIAPWVAKAWREIGHCQTIAMLLPASRTEQGWWQRLVEPLRDRSDGENCDYVEAPGGFPVEFFTRFLSGRTRFGHPGNPEGVGVGSPPFGCVLLVWRRG